MLISKMPEEQQPEANRPAPAKGIGPRRRRGHRGGRGRGRGLRPPAKEGLADQPPVADSAAPIESSPVEPPMTTGPQPIRLSETPVRPAPSRPRFQPPVPVQRAAPPEGSAISQAVHEVTEVVESLRQALEQMEEVLELVELAERQKLTDEREIESLLRALRQFQSRGGRFDHPEFLQRHEREERPARPGRPERFNRPPRPERPAPPERPENPPPVGPSDGPESPPND